MVIVVSFPSFNMSQLLGRHLNRQPRTNHITVLALEMFIATLLNFAPKFAIFGPDIMSVPIEHLVALWFWCPSE